MLGGTAAVKGVNMVITNSFYMSRSSYLATAADRHALRATGSAITGDNLTQTNVGATTVATATPTTTIAAPEIATEATTTSETTAAAPRAASAAATTTSAATTAIQPWRHQFGRHNAQGLDIYSRDVSTIEPTPAILPPNASEGFELEGSDINLDTDTNTFTNKKQSEKYIAADEEIFNGSTSKRASTRSRLQRGIYRRQRWPTSTRSGFVN